MTRTDGRAVRLARQLGALLVGLALTAQEAGPARAFDPAVLESVVSVLPVWPDLPSGGSGGDPEEPEATAVAIAPGGYLVTAFHVVDRASEILLRLNDGRLVPAELAGSDPPTDLALLKAELELPVPERGARPALAAPVCTIGNQFGLGLSVTCGVVSAPARSGVGFNPIEDFIQTDATVNPGASGGALVDRDGRLVGILSAIFTKDSDADIGVNFAVSLDMTLRVVDDLIAHGRVIRARSGLRVEDLDREERRSLTGARVTRVSPDSAAAQAGVAAGDLVVRVAERLITRASDVGSALQLYRPGDRVEVTVRRGAESITAVLALTR